MLISNNHLDGAPTEITNDDGDGGYSGGGGINDVNVQTTTKAITLTMNGGVGINDVDEVVDYMEKANYEDGGNIILLTEEATTKVLSGKRKLISCKTAEEMVEGSHNGIVLLPMKNDEKG